MKKIIVLVIGMVIFCSGYAQNKITGVSTYDAQDDSICITVTELNYFISHARLVCSKVDTFDDGSMVKTIEIESRDTSFRFTYAYLESNTFYLGDINKRTLKCNLAVVDKGEFYEVYELNAVGRRYFERMINNTPLAYKCPYE